MLRFYSGQFTDSAEHAVNDWEIGEIINMMFTVQRPWYQLLKNLTSLNFQTCLFFQKLDSH